MLAIICFRVDGLVGYFATKFLNLRIKTHPVSSWRDEIMKVGQCKVQSGTGSDKEREEDGRVVEECLRPKSSIPAIVLIVTGGLADFQRAVLDLNLDAIHLILSFHVTELVQAHRTKFFGEDPRNFSLGKACKLTGKGLHFGRNLTCVVVILSHSRRRGGLDR